MKVIVSLSGGIDSTTVLAHALLLSEVQAVGFRYGSKHNEYENRAAQAVAKHYGVSFRLIDLTPVFDGFTSALMKSGEEIPEGHYEDESMSKTVVPGRNIIFSSVLSGVAWSVGASEVWLGIHSGDHAIYPDCRPGFYEAMAHAVKLGTGDRVNLKAPFLHVDKGEILKWGVEHDIPYHLTRTCYKDQELACGKCGSCVERLEACASLGVDDPVRYE